MSVSADVRDAARQWQTVVALVPASIVDKLHWYIMGRGTEFPKATLHTLVDPYISVVTNALNDCLALLDSWTL